MLIPRRRTIILKALPQSDEDLDTLSEITPQDLAEAQATAKERSATFGRLLDATPVEDEE